MTDRSLSSFLPFVNRQAERVERLADECSDSKPERRRRLQGAAAEFRSLAEALERVPAESVDKKRRSEQTLTPSDLEDLPQALIDQLSLTQSDLYDFEIVQVIEDNGGISSLDHLLIHLYRLRGEINERSKLNSRLYRMTQKGLLFSVPGRKGVYSVSPPAEDEAPQAPIERSEHDLLG